MSRSRKKHPYCTDHHVKTSQERKKFANKKVRNTEDVPSGGAYKKCSESWDICDFKFYQTKEEAIKYYEENKEDPTFKKMYPNLKVYLRQWYVWYKGK